MNGERDEQWSGPSLGAGGESLMLDSLETGKLVVSVLSCCTDLNLEVIICVLGYWTCFCK